MVEGFFGSFLNELFPDSDVGDAMENATNDLWNSEFGQAIQNLTEGLFGDDGTIEDTIGDAIEAENDDDDNNNEDEDEFVAQLEQLNDSLLDLTEEVLGGVDESYNEVNTDINELFANLTIPEEYMGVINIDQLFGSLFAPILSFFNESDTAGVFSEGSSEGLRSPFLSDPVPFGTECTFCSGEFDRDAQFAGLSCMEWEVFTGFSRAEECSILRAAAVHSCGCKPTEADQEPLFDQCPFCYEGNLEGDDIGLPTLSQKLFCSNIVDLPAVDGQKTCDDIAKFSENCNCGTPPPPPPTVSPTASPTKSPTQQDAESTFTETTLEVSGYLCTLCSQAGEISASPDKIVFPGNGGSLASMTCAQVDAKLAADSESEGDCDQGRLHVENTLGVSVEEFCGCPSALLFQQEQLQDAQAQEQEAEQDLNAPAAACEPCPSGYSVRQGATSLTAAQMTTSSLATETETAIASEGTTCPEWAAQVANLLEDDEVCVFLRANAMAECCVREEGMVTFDDETTVSREEGGVDESTTKVTEGSLSIPAEADAVVVESSSSTAVHDRVGTTTGMVVATLFASFLLLI